LAAALLLLAAPDPACRARAAGVLGNMMLPTWLITLLLIVLLLSLAFLTFRKAIRLDRAERKAARARAAALKDPAPAAASGAQGAGQLQARPRSARRLEAARMRGAAGRAGRGSLLLTHSQTQRHAHVMSADTGCALSRLQKGAGEPEPASAPASSGHGGDVEKVRGQQRRPCAKRRAHASGTTSCGCSQLVPCLALASTEGRLL